MSPVGILFLIFATCVLLVGFYMFRGNELKAVSWKAAYKGVTKQGWKKIGKWTMIVSILIYILAIVAIICDWS
jgi:uncharacterized membrane protein YfcA